MTALPEIEVIVTDGDRLVQRWMCRRAAMPDGTPGAWWRGALYPLIDGDRIDVGAPEPEPPVQSSQAMPCCQGRKQAGSSFRALHRSLRQLKHCWSGLAKKSRARAVGSVSPSVAVTSTGFSAATAGSPPKPRPRSSARRGCAPRLAAAGRPLQAPPAARRDRRACRPAAVPGWRRALPDPCRPWPALISLARARC